MEDGVAEASVRADVDGRGGGADTPDQLALVVGAALGEDPHLPELLGALVRLGPGEDRGEVVGDDDHAEPLAKSAWAAATPAPASVLYPRSRTVSSSADSVGST